MKVTIEATDEADALTLKQIMSIFLGDCYNGDYSGRVIKVEK